ncbi:MAG: hypothetical protein IPQ06_15840 [Chitinophagaceae bacterium]|nr:hypothetical protein [Chitinophagaceae bacterium]
MEVHHHAHTADPDPSTSSGPRGRKKWTHYFWEFLMLFLAVFCGFLAENLREHKVEHIRAKEFSKSLVQDLQHDTTAIHVQKKSAGVFISLTDSLLTLSKTRLEGRNASRFSFYTRFMYWTVPISWNRATFDQIKNSGSLRYFKNYHLLEKLMKYDVLVNEIEAEFNNHQTRGNTLLNSINKIIEPAYHHDLSKYFIWSLDTLSRETMEIIFAAETASLEPKRSEIRELLNMTVVQQRNLRFGNTTRWQRAEALALELISDLKKEYHLK